MCTSEFATRLEWQGWRGSLDEHEEHPKLRLGRYEMVVHDTSSYFTLCHLQRDQDFHQLKSFLQAQ